MDRHLSMMESLPDRIGPYPVCRLLGTGAMGQVFLGHDPVINRPVAIKTIRRHLLGNGQSSDDTENRFRLEAQAAGRLHHPGIVAIYQFGHDHGSDYIAMEYVDGHNLSDYIDRPSRFSREDVLCLMSQLLDAIDYAHNNGVIHRDIKPANLMISREGQLKITDFGIARLEATQLTRTNMMVGSPGFMAPEQYTDDKPDRRVDVFSAGVLLYYLLTGKVPFSGTNEAVMYKVMHEMPAPLQPSDDGRDLADFWPVVLTALAKRPQQRYASARAMQDALAGLARDEPISRLLAITRVQPRPGTEPSAFAPRPAQGPPARSQFAALLTPAPSSSTSMPPSSVTPWPTGWDEATLAGLERDLARHVGPIARVVVRKAARQFSSLGEVRQEVAYLITDPVERHKFVQQSRAQTGVAPRPNATDLQRRPATNLQPRSDIQPRSGYANSQLPSHFPTAWPPPPPARNGRYQTTPTNTPGNTPSNTPTGFHSGRDVLLDAAALERAGTALAKTIGPIAKVLVRRSAAKSCQREEFIELVLAQLDPRLDIEALRLQLLKVL
jgi:serine/threonine-protein kinase